MNNKYCFGYLLLLLPLAPHPVHGQNEVKFFTEQVNNRIILKLRITLVSDPKDIFNNSIGTVKIVQWKDDDQDCRIVAIEKKVDRTFEILPEHLDSSSNMVKAWEAYYTIDTFRECRSADQYLAEVNLVRIGKYVVDYVTDRAFFKKCPCRLRNEWPVLFAICNLLDIIIKNTKGENLVGHGVFRYDILSGKIETLIRDTNQIYSAPRVSPNNRLLVCTVKERATGKNAVVVLDIATKTEVRFGEGHDDATPYWLTDNEGIVFVRDQKICIGNITNASCVFLATAFAADKILYTSYREGRYNIVYTAKYEYKNNDRMTQYRQILLDGNLNCLEDEMLIPDEGWKSMGSYSVTGDTLLTSHADNIGGSNKMYYYILRSNEAMERPIFPPDTFHYFDPSWGGYSKQIVFVSNR